MSAPRNVEDWVILDIEAARLVDGGSAWCVGLMFWRDGQIQYSVIDSERRRDALAELERVVQKIRDYGTEVITYNGSTFDLFWIHQMLNRPVQIGRYNDAKSLCDWIIHQRDLPHDEQMKSWDMVKAWSHPKHGSFVEEKHLDLISRTVNVDRSKGTEGHPRPLKMISAVLGFDNIVEAPYPHDMALTPEQWQEVVSYNRNDLELTYKVWEHFSGTVSALAVLSEEVGDDLRNLTDAKVGEAVLKAKFVALTGAEAGKSEVPSEITLDLIDIPRLETPAAAQWQQHLETATFPILPTGSIDLKSPSALTAVQSLKLGHHTVDVAFGGLHGQVDKPGVYKTDDTYRVLSVDVASYYPAILISKNLPIGSMGTVGTGILRELRDRRIIEKGKAKDKSLSKPDRDKAHQIQNALKISINSVFGKTGSIYSALYSPRTMPSVCISGELHLVALIERLVALNQNDDDDVVRILDSNTDGLYIRVRRDDDRWQGVLDEWQAESGFELEVEELDAIILKSQNNRATVKAGKVSGKGSALRGEDDYYTGHSRVYPTIVPHAVIQALLHGTPPETTIRNCTDPKRFLHVKRFGKGIGVSLVDQNGDSHQFGRIVRCYSAYPDKGLQVRTTAKTDNSGLPKTIGLAMRMPDRMPPDLYWADYVADARELLAEFQPEYNPDQLTGAALELWNRGLVPSPAKRKADAKGVSVKNPAISLEDWSRYPTIKCHTGRKPGGVEAAPGVIVLDIDEADKWLGVIGLDVEQMVELKPMTVHSSDDPDNVRRAMEKGKLIFRFDDPDHWFNKLPAKPTAGLQKAGVEIFYGQKLAAVLGAGEGKTYYLSGELQPLPEWLELILRKLTGRKAPKPPEPPKPRKPRVKPDLAVPVAFEGRGDGTDLPFATDGISAAWSGELYQPDEPDIGDDEEPPDFDMYLEELANTIDERFRAVVGEYGVDRKNHGDDHRWMAMCECPGGLESHNYTRKGFYLSDRDGMIQLDQTTGRPVYSCLHGSCTFADEIRQKTNSRDWAIRNYCPDGFGRGGSKPDQAVEELEPTDDGTDSKTEHPETAISRIILSPPHKVTVIKAPTGSGKTYSSALAAGLAHRQGRDVVYTAPTKLALSGFLIEFQKLNPDLVKHIHQPTNNELQEEEADSETDDEAGEMVASFEPGSDDDTIELKPAESRKIYLICHESLGRRGFSRFMRVMWQRIEAMTDPLIMVDESHMFIRGFEVKRRLSGVVSVEQNANGRILWKDQSQCPANTILKKGGVRFCDVCKHVEVGTVYDINWVLKTPEIRQSNHYTQGYADREPVLSGGHHVVISLDDFELGEKLYPDPKDRTGWVQYVRSYKGRAINKANRQAETRRAYRGNQTSKEGTEFFENYKTAGLVLEHELAHLFAGAIRFSEPVHKEGNQAGKPISPSDILKIHADGRRDAVVFPVRACGSYYVSGYDLAAMERIHDLAIQNNTASVVFMSASHEPLDMAMYTEVFGVKGDGFHFGTVEGQPDQIEGLTVVSIGPADDNGGWNDFACLSQLNVSWLKPLDTYGQWLVFATGNRQKKTLETIFKLQEPSYPFVTAVGSGTKLNEGRHVTPDGGSGDPGTLASTRSPIGCGFNGVNVASVLSDYRAIRLALDLIIPEPADQDSFYHTQSAERDASIIQNMGRSLRGHPEKRSVVFLVNASMDSALELIQKANIQSRIKELIQFRHYYEFNKKPFEDAAQWLAGGNWEVVAQPLPERGYDARNKARHKTKKNKREVAIASMLESAKAWKAGGGGLGEFVRRQNLHLKTTSSMPGILTMVQQLFRFEGDDDTHTKGTERTPEQSQAPQVAL